MPWILVARATRIESFQPLNATENALYNNALYVFNCNSLCNSLYLSDSNAKYANPFIHSCIPMHTIHQYYTPTHNSCIHSYPNHSLMQYNSQDNAMLFIHAGLITVRYIHTTCSAIRTVTEIPLYVQFLAIGLHYVKVQYTKAVAQPINMFAKTTMRIVTGL